MNREETDMAHRQMEVYKGKRGHLCQNELVCLVVHIKGKKWPNNLDGQLQECRTVFSEAEGMGKGKICQSHICHARASWSPCITDVQFGEPMRVLMVTYRNVGDIKAAASTGSFSPE